MSTTPPTIQVLSRNNYEDQYLISLPDALPLPELGPSSIRVKTSTISLTTNSLTYGRIGHLLRTWNIIPLPPSIPTEFSDANKFGRIPAWGYATVIESNVSGIEAGSQVFGTVPMGTLPLEMKVQVNSEISESPGRFVEVSKHRENVMPLYNKYLFYPPVAQRTPELEKSQGYDALFQIFFTTSYLINRFSLPWNPAEFVHPRNGDVSWTVEKGSIDDKTIVLVLADSGKTALALAYLLKNCRPAGSRPGMVVGIGSSASRAFVKKTDLYDRTLTYEADSGDLDHELGLTSDSKVLICEFGSRGGAGQRWEKKLSQTNENVVQLVMAGEVIKESPEKATERFLARSKIAASVFNASDALTEAIQVLGEKRYFEELIKEWSSFKEREPVKGFHMVWGKGLEDVGKGWEKLCKGEVGADESLVFSLD